MLWLSASNALVASSEFELTDGLFLQRLMILNLVLAVFNLLPAFPMDGGRVLRAALSLRMQRDRATQTAARIGQGLALGLGFLGLLYNPFLMFIALFVWIGAAAEAGAEQIKSTLSDITVGHAMLTDYHVLAPDDSLGRAAELTLTGSQKDFPVVENGIPVGALTQAELLQGLHQTGRDTRVSDWMQKEIQSADVNEPVERVMERLQAAHSPLIAVTHRGELAGIVNLDNIAELIQIQTAIREQRNNSQLRA